MGLFCVPIFLSLRARLEDLIEQSLMRLAIQDFLWSEWTGLPVEQYTEDDVQDRADDVYRHVFRVYPRLPSPYYGAPPVA